MVGFTKRIKGRKIFYYYIEEWFLEATFAFQGKGLLGANGDNESLGVFTNEGILDFEVFVNNVAFVQYVRSFGNF
jgi:hypothetical protein